MDGSGNAYVTGATSSTNFPTKNPIQGKYEGYYDVFVAKIAGGQSPVCGNGIVELPEQCDDHNTADGDGCSATCTIESGWTCSGSPSGCSQQQLAISTITLGGPGTISCTQTTVYYNGSTDCTMAPDQGYYVADVQVGPTGGTFISVGTVTEYIISPVVADMTIAAIFELHLVKRITGSTGVYYMYLQDAFDEGLAGDVIQLQNITFDGDFNFNSASVTLKGGYNSEFASRTGFSTIQGSLTIRGGTLIVDAIVVQ